MIHGQVSDFLLRKRRRQGPTYGQYQFTLERILLPWCEGAGLTDATQVDDTAMMRLTDALLARERPLSPVTIQTYIRAIRVFLNWAKVPKGDYEPVHVPHRLVDTLTAQEIDRMENAASTERDKLIIRVLADTGARVGELAGLRPKDLRGDTATKKYFVRVIGKGDKEREVGVPRDTYRRLRQFALGAGDFIFTRGGERLGRHNIEYVVRKAARQAGIKRRVWPHLLRHSYATDLLKKNVSEAKIAKSMGHTSPMMIWKVYGHTTAADSYDEIMSALADR
jgi:integrase